MVLTPFILVLISVIGYLNFNASSYGKMRLKRLSPGALTINLVAFGTLHCLVGVLIVLCVSMFALQFSLNETPSWLLSFSGIATDYRVPLAIPAIIIASAGSAFLAQFATSTGRRRAHASELELAKELADSEIELSYIQALEAENHLPVDEISEQVPLLFRAVLRNRKVYIGNLTQYDIIRGHSKSIVIQPLVSGYQNEKTLELEITEHYGLHYQKAVNLGDNEAKSESSSGGTLSREQLHELLAQFSVTIPVNEIVTTSMFSLRSYIDFLLEKQNQPRS